MNDPKIVVVNTLSPANSESAIAAAVNTISPDKSESPALAFGRLIVTSLSPESSLTPAIIEFEDGSRISLAPEQIESLVTIDTLLTSLLTEDEQLGLSAKQLLRAKVAISIVLTHNQGIRDTLRKGIDGFLHEGEKTQE